MSDLDKIEIGERVVSRDEEDEGAAGEVIEARHDGLRVRWDDGTITWTHQGTVRREDLNLTLDQINGFEFAALTAAIPTDLAPHFEAVVAAARRDVMLRLSSAKGQLAADARAELARTGDETELRDRVAALMAIFLRDAIVLAGGDATVAALDHLGVRDDFLEAASQLTETAMLVPHFEDALSYRSNEQLRTMIGQVMIDAAAVRVITKHEDYERIAAALSRMPKPTQH